MFLKELLTLKRGFDLPESKRISGKYLIYSSNGIAGMHNAFKVKGPAVITGRSGTLGTVQYSENDCWPLNTTLYVSDFKGNIPKYISYLLETLHLEKYGSGSAVPTLNRNHLDLIEVKHHNILMQQHIVDIIGSIDDKIENNNKIIDNNYKMLNLEMKKYIKNEFISIGESEHIFLIKSGIDKFDGNKIYLDTSSVNGYSITDESYIITYDERPSRANMQPIINSIWFAKLKNSPKYIIAKDYSTDLINNKIFSTGFCGLKIDKDFFNLFSTYITSEEFNKNKDQLCIGATMQGVNNSDINNISIPNFSKNDCENFNIISEPIYKYIYNLTQENKKLLELKDLYLKKFFS